MLVQWGSVRSAQRSVQRVLCCPRRSYTDMQARTAHAGALSSDDYADMCRKVNRLTDGTRRGNVRLQ